MTAPDRTSAPDPDRSDRALLRAAFRDLHGRRLHGFALLVSVGDRVAASQATADVLFEAGSRLDQLEHPERAAAWLRARVLDTLRRGRGRRTRLGEKTYMVSLAPLGVSVSAAHALARLPITERAALVATDVEKLDPRDVATVVKMAPAASARLVRRARERYLRHAAVRPAAERGGPSDVPDGPLGIQVRDVAGRTLASIEDHR